MDARIDNTALKRIGQMTALHWVALVLELVIPADIAGAVIASGDSFGQALVEFEGLMPTATYVVWTLRLVQVLAQIVIIVSLSSLIDAHGEFADARFIYVILMILVAITLMMEGFAAGGDLMRTLEHMAVDRVLLPVLVIYVALEAVAKPVLLAVGNRTILFGCAATLDSFGLVEHARKTRAAGVRFSVCAILFALLCVAAAVIAIAELRAGVLSAIVLGRQGPGAGEMALLAILACALCAAVAYLIMWLVSARSIGRTHDLLEELAS